MKYQKMNTIIARCAAVNAAEIKPETSLVYDLHMDSMMFTEMICDLENEFLIKVEDKDVSDLHCVRDVYAYLDKQMLS